MFENLKNNPFIKFVDEDSAPSPEAAQDNIREEEFQVEYAERKITQEDWDFWVEHQSEITQSRDKRRELDRFINDYGEYFRDLMSVQAQALQIRKQSLKEMHDGILNSTPEDWKAGPRYYDALSMEFGLRVNQLKKRERGSEGDDTI